ncbi:alpha-E domain-containing protein [Phaeobacter sp. B1627]|uniref:alpha-E domain-containing protein n=1 Tax=Phaeobacter sp. B1627 TaxID=2583809 RepID=UPI001118E65A|nr:alpha-E domain-containing protein [Phaeobacter sp. B1627]TNJ47459.1 alpha-E domain-containing protein [Phaeobacter sp. B1627]
MLGRTAGGLFWMFRYLERAENNARLLEAGWHIALTRSDGSTNEWESIVRTAGQAVAFDAKHDEYTAQNVINFLLRDMGNPSSVMASVDSARSNARQVRTALSREVWEATNECWMVLKGALSRPVSERNLHETLALIRNRASVVRGALHGTMLRNDIFSFARLGTFIERSDSTARILDVKYYVLLPSAAFVGSSMDNVQWEVILRSVSAERSFSWLHAGSASPQRIAEFLILDERMPRSLAFCSTKVAQYLKHLERDYGIRHESHVVAECIADRVQDKSIETIFQNGLHEFLGEFVQETVRLANHIEKDFRFYG